MHLIAKMPDAANSDRQRKPASFKKPVNLNDVVGQAIKEVCPPGMIIRRDSLPVIEGSSLQLQHAFRKLVQGVAAIRPAKGAHFLYFKFIAPGPFAPGLKSNPDAGTIAVYSNSRGVAVADASLREAGTMVHALLEVNGIQIKMPETSGDDLIYLLTLAGKPVV